MILKLAYLIFMATVYAQSYPWSYKEDHDSPYSPAGDVVLKEGTPWGVNLATALQSIGVYDQSYIRTMRVKNLQDDRVTVIVQLHEDWTKSIEKTVMFADVPDTYCNPKMGIWPGVMVEALRQAGWPIHSPLSIRDALQALTGIKANEIYKTGTEGVDSVNFWDTVLEPMRGSGRPLILETCPDRADKLLKPNFTYTVRLVSDREHLLDLTDPAGKSPENLDPSQKFDDIFKIYALEKPLPRSS